MSRKTHIPKPKRTEQGRRLRRESTKSERVLWGRLRDRRLGGYKFKRQVPIEPFIVDFYCHAANLVVEVDGLTHDGRGEQDEARDRVLEKQGYDVMHVTSDDVFRDIDAVMNGILMRIERILKDR